MKVTLFQAPLPTTLLLPEIFETGLQYMPLNLAYLGAVLETRGHQVNIIDLNILMKPIMSFAEQDLDSLDCDVAGITCTTSSYYEALNLASTIKTRYPEMIIIIGGCHVTFTSEATLRECEAVDIVVRGEGELVLEQLIEKLEKKASLDSVLGITYREGDDIRKNPDAPVLENLDELPFPDRHLLPVDLYPFQGIVTSRGCPRKCIFCSAGAMSNGKYRIRSANSIVSELRLLNGKQNILFYDNTFSGFPTKSMEICRAIIAADLDITWETELRADSVSQELIDLLVQAGCRAIQFGVESGSDLILKEIRKHITLEQVRRGVEMALSRGLGVACSFTIGHPSDTEKTIRETIDFMLELQNAGCKVIPGIITPYPGTELFNRSEEFGVIIHDYKWDLYSTLRVCMSTKYLTKERLGQLFMELLMEIDHENIRVSEG